MSLDELKSLAASKPELTARLATVQSFSDLQAIAAEVGINLEESELEDVELSSAELSSVSGGIGMMLRSKLGFGLSSAAADTNDLNKCTTDTNDDTITCKPIVSSTRKGDGPNCG